MKMDRLLTYSNGMSMLRIILVIPIIYFLLEDDPSSRFIALLFMLIAGATDYLDGYFARRFQQVSDLGRILDPLADKLAIISIILVLTWKGEIPQWYASLIISRDLLIVIGASIVRKRIGSVLQSNRIGKITVTVIALTIILATAQASDLLLNYAIWLSVILSLLTLILYFGRAIRAFQTTIQHK